MENQFLLDALIELTPQQLLVENDGISADGSLLLASTNQPIVSNQTMVDLGKKLLQAASENDIENVKALMTGGAPFTGNWLGSTPLHAASKAGHIDTVELLLKAGIFRDAKTKVDRTALQMAAEEGHTSIVRMLIEHSADVNAKDMLKMTALHWAVERGHVETVIVLLEHGADVMALNKFDKSSIDIACDNGFDDILQLLEAAMDQNASKETCIESQAAAEKLMNELAATDKISWKHSSEEEALEKLTANTIGNLSSTNEAAKLLESHGITLLPVDNTTLLTSALESGQSISLTEAGKLALNHMNQPSTATKAAVGCSPAKKLKLSPGCSINVSIKNASGGIPNPRVVTMSTEQFLALATAGKLHQGKSNKPMLITLPKKLANGGKKISAGSGHPMPSPTANSPSKTTITTINKNDLVNSLAQLLSGHGSNFKNNSANSAKVVNNDVKRISTENEDVSDRPLKAATANTFSSTNSVPKIASGSVHSLKTFRSAPNASSVRTTDSVPVSLERSAIETSAVVSVAPKNCEQISGSGALDREHFLKSGLLKGSARTTPIALLCRKDKAVTPDVCKFSSVNSNETCSDLVLEDVTTISEDSQIPPPAVALSADLCLNDDMFNEDSGESNSNKAVWLSILEDQNSQFASGNDEDLLDPTRLAAQLASIRQAASRFSFSN